MPSNLLGPYLAALAGLLCLGLGLAGCGGDASSPATKEPASLAPAEEAHILEEIEAWRSGRHASLQRPDGWLSLVGLVWLEPGENGVGSAEQNRVRLPDSSPPRVGALRLDEGVVVFEAEPGADATIDGEPATTAELRTDADGETTEVHVGPVHFYIIVRQDRFGVRIKDSQAAPLLAFEGMESFPVDLQWRLSARFLPYDPPRAIQVPDILGNIGEQESPGALELTIDGETHALDTLPGGDDGSFFLVFGDTTNGHETYGGGRFLYTDPPAEDGTVVVDFNRAYNPPCVFSPYATCPLPPTQNKLDLAIRAGEKSYSDSAH